MLAQVQQPFTITALGAQTSAVALPVPRASGECVLKAVARADGQRAKDATVCRRWVTLVE